MLHLTVTSLRALCDVQGRGEQGGTRKNVQRLVPVGGQHQDRRRYSHHSLLWADWTLPRRLFLLKQVDTPRSPVNDGAMKGHGGRHHVRVRGLSYRERSRSYLSFIFWCLRGSDRPENSLHACVCVCTR